MGLMQLMPGRRVSTRSDNPYDPRAQHRCGRAAPASPARSVRAPRGPRGLQRRRRRRAAVWRHPPVSRDALPTCARILAFPGSRQAVTRPCSPQCCQRSLADLRQGEASDSERAAGVAIIAERGHSPNDEGSVNPLRLANRIAMEFRCRLVSAAGEIIEGVYAAESEARLRQELEERGLHVLASSAPAPSAAGRSRCRGGPRPPARVPRVQPGAGDAAQGGHAARAVAGSAPERCQRQVFQPVLDGVHERVKAGTRAVAKPSRSTATLFPACLHGVAPRGRAKRQPRDGAAPLRGVRQG